MKFHSSDKEKCKTRNEKCIDLQNSHDMQTMVRVIVRTLGTNQGRSQHGARGGGNCPPQSWALPHQSGLAPATVVSLRLAMGQLRLEKCIKTTKI